VKRRLFNLAAAVSLVKLRRTIADSVTVLSLLLCVATVAIWVRGHWFYDSVKYGNGRWMIEFESGWGELRLTWTH
jgi:hypothetical protein